MSLKLQKILQLWLHLRKRTEWLGNGEKLAFIAFGLKTIIYIIMNHLKQINFKDHISIPKKFSNY